MDYPGPPADDQQQLADNQQPPAYDQQPSAPTDDKQPSAPTDDLKSLADTKRPPTDDELPPSYDQLTKKTKFVSPPLNASRWPSPYSQQPYIPLEYPEQSNIPVVNQPAGDGIFSVYNPGQRYTTSAGGRFYPGQRYTTTEEYPEDECLKECCECCEFVVCLCYCMRCMLLFCEILAACK